jgi:SM-20-related protein
MLRPFMIETYDGLVPPALVSAIFAGIHQPVYKFGQKSNPGDTFGFWIANIDEEVRANVQPLDALWRIVDERITEGTCEIDRMYVNAYTHGDCPTVHADHSDADNFTVLYYANEEWHWDWAGETVFYNEARDEITRAIYPRPGRVVAFDGRLPHVAREPSRACAVVRYTIAMKLRLVR